MDPDQTDTRSIHNVGPNQNPKYFILSDTDHILVRVNFERKSTGDKNFKKHAKLPTTCMQNVNHTHNTILKSTIK